MTNPLTDLRQTIREHWAAYCPRMYAELEASGEPGGAVEAVIEAGKDGGGEQLRAWVEPYRSE